MLKWTSENRRGEVASATIAGQSAAYAYDALSRLVAVYSNDTLVVSNRYDHLGRRVQKVAADGTHTFLYDGWRPVVETIVRPDATTDRIDYVWGKDISGTLDGAAGLGGLLYVKLNGVIFVPFCDAYGNVKGYRDADGNVVAVYVYDAFGRAVAQNGTMADVFAIRYSTKYYDAEVGLYYYGKRHYSPVWRRWLTRDPIGEEGGVNLYEFCGNSAVERWDADGRAYFAVRKLKALPFELSQKSVMNNIGGFADRHNLQLLHEHLFFQDGKYPRDIGYGEEGHLFDEDFYSGYVQTIGGFDDCIMRKAINMVSTPMYSLVGRAFLGFQDKYNCQDFCADLRRKYEEIKDDSAIKKQCCKESR